MPSRGFFRFIRITILLLILFFVGMNSYLTKLRSTDWNDTLWMVVYPINGDGSKRTQAYIDRLSENTYDRIESFIAGEAQRYGQSIDEPVTVRLAPQVSKVPPAPPVNGSTLSIMLWSLKLRYWSYRNGDYDGPQPDVRMFVVYHDPTVNQSLAHSLGLQKGMIGVVNAFAGRKLEQRNNVVIAHEFLHTLGATDKYNDATNQPIYPDGYAEPGMKPLYPQRKAEIMGGRIPLSDRHSVMPKSVASSSIGERTAAEINWIQ